MASACTVLTSRLGPVYSLPVTMEHSLMVPHAPEVQFHRRCSSGCCLFGALLCVLKHCCRFSLLSSHLYVFSSPPFCSLSSVCLPVACCPSQLLLIAAMSGNPTHVSSFHFYWLHRAHRSAPLWLARWLQALITLAQLLHSCQQSVLDYSRSERGVIARC